MAEEGQGKGAGRIAAWAAVFALLGGFLGGGAEGLLKWLEFRSHLSERTQDQVIEIVKLATALDKGRVAAAADYIAIVSTDLPAAVREKLLVIVARQSTSGPTANAGTAAKVTSAFPEVVAASPELLTLLLPGNPRVFIQIARADQKAEAEAIRKSLGAAGVTAPGIAVVERYARPPHLRYFFAQDQ